MADPALIATRRLDTDSGVLTVEFWSTSESNPFAFEYRLIAEDGGLVDSMRFYGEDQVQALLFCLAGAGDYLDRFVSSANWLESGSHALLHTVPGAAIWQAHTA